jgi:hypothetical protein
MLRIFDSKGFIKHTLLFVTKNEKMLRPSYYFGFHFVRLAKFGKLDEEAELMSEDYIKSTFRKDQIIYV